MAEAGIRNRLRELTEILASPAEKTGGPKGSYQANPHSDPTRSNEEILDQLRLQIKYLLFDLEATRRENQYLRQMLERRSNTGDGSDST